MATSGTKLALVFRDVMGDKINFSYNYADPSVDATAVRALMNGMITNGSIFVKSPTTVYSAEVVTTNVRDIELS